MKKKLYIKTALLSLMSMVLLNSCLKDPRYVDFSKVGTLIELPLAEPDPTETGPGGVFQQPTYSLAKGVTDTLTVAVNVASPQPLGSALAVTLTTSDLTALNNYNTANGTNLIPLPSADFTVIGSLTATVPANQRLAYVKFVINVNTIGVDPGTYVLPVTIASASGQPIAQPYKALLYNIIVTP